MTERDDVRWGLGQRFEFIEWRLSWSGRVNRKEIEDKFGISTPQASVDLRSYQDSAPDNIIYNSTEKAYVPSTSFRPNFLSVSADKYLLQLNAILTGAISSGDTWFGSPPPSAVVPTVGRSVDFTTLCGVLNAIQKRQEVDVVYQSLTNTRRRAISPHSIAFDGRRWHARAWCADNEEFRDFVLTRMLSLDGARASGANPTDDVEWNTLVELNIEADPRLDVAQRSAIEHDFGMTERTLRLKTRLALAFYVVARLNLDLPDESIKPERRQICLTNLTELNAARDAAKQEAKLRVVKRAADQAPRTAET